MLRGQAKNLMLVINPSAGKNKARDQLFPLIDIFFRNGYQVCVYPTQAKGDACRYVAEYAESFQYLVCVGGDGTLNEVVTGLMFLEEHKRPRLGYIPAGTTNDFANTLGISSDMLEAAQQFIVGEPFRCDMGRFNGRYFTYVAAFGIFTEVSYSTPQPLKNALGHMAYILEGVRSLSTIKSYHLTVTADEERMEGDFIYGQVSNSTSIGGIVDIANAGVQLDDGLFEVMMIQMPNNLLILNDIVASLMQQKPQESQFIFFRRAKHVRIEAEQPLAWTLDGESGGSFAKSEAKIIPHAFTINLEHLPTDPLAGALPLHPTSRGSAPNPASL